MRLAISFVDFSDVDSIHSSGDAMSTATSPMVSSSGRDRLRSPDSRAGTGAGPARSSRPGRRFVALGDAVREAFVGVLTWRPSPG